MSLAHAVPFDEPLPDCKVSPDRTIRAALALVGGLPALPVRSAALLSSHDRILAERVRAEADSPSRDCAAVDGYAFSGDILRGEGPWRLRLTGRIAVARNLAADAAFPSREAVRISAGGAMPEQLDTVVPAHATRREGDYIILDTRPAPGSAIRRQGEGARCGDVIAQPDRLLDARDVASLATAGCTTVKVRRTLRVAVLALGHAKQESGAAGRAMLMAALDRRWISRHDLGTVSGGALIETLRMASEETDMIVAINRAGMAEAIEAAGGHIVLDGIAIEPGGSVKLALLGDLAIILLPEEPIAGLTAMAVLGWSLLRRRAGIQHSRSVPRAGIAAFSRPADPECAAYPLVRVEGAGGIPTLETLDDQEGSMTALSRADGFAILSRGEDVGFGSQIAWLPLNDRFS